MIQWDELRALKKNWDSYGADPISEEAIKYAQFLLDNLHVVPLCNGGIQIEIGEAEIEIDSEGHAEYYFEQ